jgi:hypothetical protein
LLFFSTLFNTASCRHSDSNVLEDAGTEHRTVATSALAVRRSNHSARSHPQYKLIERYETKQNTRKLLPSCRTLQSLTRKNFTSNRSGHKWHP